MGWDYYIFSLINQYAGQNLYFDKAFVFFAEYLMALFLLFFIIEFKNARAVWNAVFSSALSAAINIIIGLFYFRPRPFITHKINLLVARAADTSFPSDHATISFAIATSIFLYNRKAGVFAYLIAAMISFSRIFVGVHYPLDVLAGIAIGIIISLVTNLYVKRYAGYLGVG